MLLLASNALAAGKGYIVGAGVEGDTEDGLAGSLLGSFGLGEKTWLSAAVAKSSLDTQQRQSLETLYGDLEIDHWFEPFGVRVGAAYWGDPDVLDSFDWRASLYWRGDKMSISGNFEFRDFEFDIPMTQFFPGRRIMFDASGFGITARFDLSDAVDFGLSGMSYDYSVDFRPIEDRDLISLVSVSRLSPINSLIDHRGKVSLGIDHGSQRWQFALSTSEGAVDRSRTKSATISFLTPITGKSDIEFRIGYDDSELYGDVTFFSVFLFFYGAG